jgi:16S rRNA (cytosine1402-N4)-methyltransferase
MRGILISSFIFILLSGLRAAENILREGGLLAVVTFHSLEDRIVKRFIQARSGNNPRGNRYQPEKTNDIATFEKIGRKAIAANKDEINSNPRARSAKLRLARRLNTTSGEFSAFDIGLPKFNLGQLV